MQVENTVDIFSIEGNVWCGLTLTDSAVCQIRRLVEDDPTMLGLQLSIKQTGCAGFGYVIKKTTKVADNDIVYERDGSRLYIPIKVMPFIDGTELDYVQEGLNHVFKFNNPKAKHTCGCGKSFGF